MYLRRDPSKRRQRLKRLGTWFSLGRTKLDDGQTEKMRRTLHWPLLCHWPLYSRRKFEANGEQQNDRQALWPHKTTQRKKNHGNRSSSCAKVQPKQSSLLSSLITFQGILSSWIHPSSIEFPICWNHGHNNATTRGSHGAAPV